jgi:hypothetical protein
MSVTGHGLKCLFLHTRVEMRQDILKKDFPLDFRVYLEADWQCMYVLNKTDLLDLIKTNMLINKLD